MLVHIHTVRTSVEGVLTMVLTDGGTMTVHDWTRLQVWRYPSKPTP